MGVNIGADAFGRIAEGRWAPPGARKPWPIHGAAEVLATLALAA